MPTGSLGDERELYRAKVFAVENKYIVWGEAIVTSQRVIFKWDDMVEQYPLMLITSVYTEEFKSPVNKDIWHLPGSLKRRLQKDYPGVAVLWLQLPNGRVNYSSPSAAELANQIKKALVPF